MRVLLLAAWCGVVVPAGALTPLPCPAPYGDLSDVRRALVVEGRRCVPDDGEMTLLIQAVGMTPCTEA